MRWLRALFAWRLVRDSGVWHYLENGVTGRRKAIRVASGCWQPLDSTFLRKGDRVVDLRGTWVVGHDYQPPIPPRGGSAVR